jgi:serine/threonine-protein kinase
MASVFVGEHKVLGHKVAIKVLHPKHLENESIERRFFNEARAIAKIRHPGIVELFDFGRGGPDGAAYIVRELLEGETLRQRIRAGTLVERQIAIFGRQIAAALHHAHKAGIIHRDLKPDNVFLVKDAEIELGERAKVLDFGIAKKTSFDTPASEHTATGILVGTPAYMSPEQCKGSGVVDARSDIYSVGVVVYRMVTNQLPFEAAGTGELIGQHLYPGPFRGHG